MDYLVTYIYLLFIHWIGDFVAQTDWQAKNKSKSFDALLRHTGTYTLALGLGSCIAMGVQPLVISFVLINGAAHLTTDYFTSRLSAKLWADGKTHEFFMAIGFDQFIHQLTIGLTLLMIIPPPH